jgi:hypothetical protein
LPGGENRRLRISRQVPVPRLWLCSTSAASVFRRGEVTVELTARPQARGRSDLDAVAESVRGESVGCEDEVERLVPGDLVHSNGDVTRDSWEVLLSERDRCVLADSQAAAAAADSRCDLPDALGLTEVREEEVTGCELGQ